MYSLAPRDLPSPCSPVHAAAFGADTCSPGVGLEGQDGRSCAGAGVRGIADGPQHKDEVDFVWLTLNSSGIHSCEVFIVKPSNKVAGSFQDILRSPWIRVSLQFPHATPRPQARSLALPTILLAPTCSFKSTTTGSTN
eukprot:760906-Hanusia_phi.AAC.7